MHEFVKFDTIVAGIITWQEQFSFLQGVSLCAFPQTLPSIRQNSVFQNMLQWSFCTSPAVSGLTKLNTVGIFIICTKTTLMRRTISVLQFSSSSSSVTDLLIDLFRPRLIDSSKAFPSRLRPLGL
jgi:hypothetical protein